MRVLLQFPNVLCGHCVRPLSQRYPQSNSRTVVGTCVTPHCDKNGTRVLLTMKSFEAPEIPADD